MLGIDPKCFREVEGSGRHGIFYDRNIRKFLNEDWTTRQQAGVGYYTALGTEPEYIQLLIKSARDLEHV